MHNAELAKAQQAKIIYNYNYKNTKAKQYKTNAPKNNKWLFIPFSKA
jgi:hypothetical protein